MTISLCAAPVRRSFAKFSPFEIWRVIGNHLSHAFRLSKLIEELFNLSDWQLREIGIARNEIWDYAEESIRQKSDL